LSRDAVLAGWRLPASCRTLRNSEQTICLQARFMASARSVLAANSTRANGEENVDREASHAGRPIVRNELLLPPSPLLGCRLGRSISSPGVSSQESGAVFRSIPFYRRGSPNRCDRGRRPISTELDSSRFPGRATRAPLQSD